MESLQTTCSILRLRQAWNKVWQFNLVRDDGVQGEEVGVRLPLVEAVVSEDHISEAGSDGVFEFAAEEEAEVEIPQHGGFREAFLELDLLSLPDHVKKRACIMKNVPHFLKGPFRNALRVALEEATSVQECRQERGWTLFILSCTASQEVG